MNSVKLFLLAALLSLTSSLRAQSVTCDQAFSDDATIKVSCTYRTKSSSVSSTRALVWTQTMPGVVLISGDARMRNVTIQPLKEGMTFVSVTATVSGKTYGYQFPPIIVAPVQMLSARFGETPPAAVPVDSVYVYTRHPVTGQPYSMMSEPCTTSPGHYCVPSPHPTYLISCAKLLAADKSTLVDSCDPNSPVSTQGILDLQGAKSIWVVSSLKRGRIPGIGGH